MLLDSAEFIPLSQKVAEYGIRSFVELYAQGNGSGIEAAQKLGLRTFIHDSMQSAALSGKYPEADIYDGDAISFLKHILPRMGTLAVLFYLDPASPTYIAERMMIEAASGTRDWFFEEKRGDANSAGDNVDSAAGLHATRAEAVSQARPVGDHSPDFDRNWMGPPAFKPKVYRSQTEKDIWMSIAVENEYHVRALQPDDLVVDIGAHTGSFSFLAHFYGSRNIKAFEVDAWHIEAAKENLAGLEGVELFHAAVVRSDNRRLKEYRYEGGSWQPSADRGQLVPSVSLDEIIERFGLIKFLKIDCEGSEWPILYTCTRLHQVAHIAGEWHSGVAFDRGDLPPATPEDLIRFLREKGFNETRFSSATETNGGFWASRWT